MSHRAVHRALVWAVLGVVAVLVAGCSGAPRSSDRAAEGSLAASADLQGQSYVVGGKDAADQRVLCEIAVAALESARARVTDRCGGGYDARAALLSGEINVYWEDTATARATFLRGAGSLPGDAARPAVDAAYRDVARRDLAENGVVWLAPAGFDESQEIAVAGRQAARLKLRTVSDMAGYLRSGQPGTLCVDGVYAGRDDGAAALQRAYAVTIPPERMQVLDPGLVPQSTADGVCTFGEVSSTDGRVSRLGLTVLDDDRGAAAVATTAPTVRGDAYERNPQIARVLDPLAAALDQATVVALNERVTTDGASPRDAARDWLARRGFIGAS